jgi:hypothetical protein
MLKLGPRWALRLVAGALAVAGWTASAQTLTGQAAAVTPSGVVFFTSFTCTGSPTCIGTHSGTELLPECSNETPIGGAIAFTGVDLSKVGGFQGKVTLNGVDADVTVNAGGSCTPSGPGGDQTLDYQGAWDGTQGGMLFSGVDDQARPFQIGATFTATDVPATTTRPPPFDMTTHVTATPTTTSATAQITYPATDIGKTESVFVFALAPRSVVKRLRAAPLDDSAAGGCVLAQLDPAGQLVQTAAGQLQPYVTGVLSAQGQAVTVLNNATNAQVPGASFFVGYGPDGATMVSQGVNRDVTTIPGATQCPAVVPANAGPLSGLWYNATESGWGIDFTQRRNVIFAAWYTYDASGNSKWYVASDCEMPVAMASSGRCTGKLYEVQGPAFPGVTFDASRVQASEAGTLQVDFADASHATVTYTVNGASRTVAIVRQVFAAGGTPPSVDFTDLWWNPSESGWGMAISHQFNVMFLAWFVYDAAGKPVWYVASNCAVTGNTCTGPLYSVSGPPLGPAFDSSQVHATPAGTASVVFSGPNDGTLSYTLGTTTATKAITRQVF